MKSCLGQAPHRFGPDLLPVEPRRFDTKAVDLQDLLRVIGASDPTVDLPNELALCGREVHNERIVAVPQPAESSIRKATRIPRLYNKPPHGPVNTHFPPNVVNFRPNWSSEKPSAQKRNFYPAGAGLNPRNFWRTSILNTDLQSLHPYSAIVRIATISDDNTTIHCTGAVVGQQTIVTAPHCVATAVEPPVILAGAFQNKPYERARWSGHAFLVDEVWIPDEWDPCSFTSTVVHGSPTDVPVPSKGSWALLHTASNVWKRDFYFNVGAVTGTLALGAIYLPDYATFPGFDSRRVDGQRLHVLDANVEAVFNYPRGLTDNLTFYDDYFNVEGPWAARGAPAIVNLGPAHDEDLDVTRVRDVYWYKLRNVVSGVVSRFATEIENGDVHSSSGSLFGDDFKEFYYYYCEHTCEDDCYVDHACGNGRIDEPPRLEMEALQDIWWIPEECDAGRTNSDEPNAPSLCRRDCTPLRCGDGIIDDLFGEECDDGILNNDLGEPGVSCSTRCRIVEFPVPIVIDDFASTPQDTAVVIDVLDNDDRVEGNTVTVFSPPTFGTVTNINPVTGAITYLPNNRFTGTETFEYQACTLQGDCDTATITVLVIVNCVEDSATTTANIPVNINVRNNDGLWPLNGITIETVAASGSLAIQPDGTVTYTPNPNFAGDDQFTYRVIVNALPNTDTATVFIVVNPIAIDDSFTVSQTAPIFNAPVADNDIGVNPQTLQSVLPNAGLASSVTFLPTGVVQYDPNVAGFDSFAYEICVYNTPTRRLCDTATVNVIVELVAVDDLLIVEHGTQGSINVATNDGAGRNPNTVVILGNVPIAAGVAATTTGGNINFFPSARWAGSTFFTYEICVDVGRTNCDNAEVDVKVLMDAVDDTFDVPQGVTTGLNIVDNDAITRNPASITFPNGPTTANGGTVTANLALGTVTYTSNVNAASSVDTIVYSICTLDSATGIGGSNCDTATITFNTALAVEDDVAFTTQDTFVDIDVEANDAPNADENSVVVIAGPSRGAANRVGGIVRYVPGEGYAGPDTFNYTICADGQPTNCGEGRVDVSVHIVSGNDCFTIPQGSSLSAGDVKPNDGWGDTNTYTLLTGPGELTGTASLHPATGIYSYTPPAEDFAGYVRAEYDHCVQDEILFDFTGENNCDEAFVDVRVLLSLNDEEFGVFRTMLLPPPNPNTFTYFEILANDNGAILDLGTLTVSPVGGANILVDTREDGFLEFFPGLNVANPVWGIYEVDYSICVDEGEFTEATCQGTTSNCDTARAVIDVGSFANSLGAPDGVELFDGFDITLSAIVFPTPGAPSTVRILNDDIPFANVIVNNAAGTIRVVNTEAAEGDFTIVSFDYCYCKTAGMSCSVNGNPQRGWADSNSFTCVQNTILLVATNQ
ncbi:Fibrinogen C-terminal domain-containing protein [Balamuthia mandrillaris]